MVINPKPTDAFEQDKMHDRRIKSNRMASVSWHLIMLHANLTQIHWQHIFSCKAQLHVTGWKQLQQSRHALVFPVRETCLQRLRAWTHPDEWIESTKCDCAKHLQGTKANLLLCLMFCPCVKEQAHFTAHAALPSRSAKDDCICLQDSLQSDHVASVTFTRFCGSLEQTERLAALNNQWRQ